MGRCGDNTSCTQQDSAISLLCTPATNDHDCLIMTLNVQVASLGQLCNLSCTTASSLEHDTCAAYKCAFMGLANTVKAGCVHLCRVASNIVWSHMARQVTPDSSEMLSHLALTYSIQKNIDTHVSPSNLSVCLSDVVMLRCIVWWWTVDVDKRWWTKWCFARLWRLLREIQLQLLGLPWRPLSLLVMSLRSSVVAAEYRLRLVRRHSPH